ncbi:MAG: hypothetical protein ACMG6S_20740 [Byssovorax sp.]
MRLPLLASAALSSLALGCSAVLPAPSEPSFPSSGSSSYSAPSAPSAPGVPQHETVTAGIVVRPDLVCFPFALRTTALDSDKAVAALRAAVDGLGQRVGAATGGALKVRMRGFAIAPAGTTKKSGGGEEDLAATVDGAFELPLAEGLDYWARTRLVASIEGAIARETIRKEEGEAPAPAANAAPVVKASFSSAQPQVKEPEAYRARLVDQWVKRARIFTEAAQNPAAPLLITDCATPGEIAQRSVSNEEVALSLSITCRIDSPRPK